MREYIDGIDTVRPSCCNLQAKVLISIKQGAETHEDAPLTQIKKKTTEVILHISAAMHSSCQAGTAQTPVCTLKTTPQGTTPTKGVHYAKISNFRYLYDIYGSRFCSKAT